jgi:hypothetical protein
MNLAWKSGREPKVRRYNPSARIKEHLEEIYNVDVLHDQISHLTNAVLEDVPPPMAAQAVKKRIHG